MSGDQLDLDALDAAYALGGRPTLSEGIALVAEVRRLREDLSKAHFIVGTHAMRAIGVEPPA